MTILPRLAAAASQDVRRRSPRRRAGKENSRKENKDSKRAAKKRQGTTMQNDFDNFDLTMGVTRTGNALARRERQRLWMMQCHGMIRE